MMRKWFIFIIGIILVINLTGCEAFVRKFTRKSKKDKSPEEMVLAPEEWKGPKMTKEEQYRQYFLFWKSWHDELINSLQLSSTQKKKIDCAQQAMKNLIGMRSLLNESKQKQLDVYLKQLADLQNSIQSDIYGTAINSYRQDSDKLKMNIQQRFSYDDIKNDLL
ncbi:MAG: hypothetical protein NTW18_02725 [Candidatus Omnitrophica bacterium]|nr:hypothetical protein [Candidatus Omnitrophota bacterium]